MPSLHTLRGGGKFVRGSCLSLARRVRCRGNTLFQRCRFFCQFPRIDLALSMRILMEGLKFLFEPARAWPFTQNITRCQQIVSREELGIKWSSGCGWFFFMPSYPNKETEAEAKSASEHTQWNRCMGMQGLWLIKLRPERQGAISLRLPSCILAALSSLPAPSPSPHPQIHLHCCLEGAQCTQIGSTVIGAFLTSASFLPAFDHSDNDSLFFQTPLPSENKRKLLKESRSYISVFWCILLWEIKFTF